MITKDTIDKIFAAARIEEIIGEYVQLKRAGSNLKGLSPFVDEKSPSFIVSPSKQIFKDFSSGKGGGVITFLKELEGFSYPEALRYLAKKYGISVEEDIVEMSVEQQQQRNQKDLIFKIHEVANDYFIDQLWEKEEGRQIGLSYFKERELRQDIIKKFQLGYSPEKKDAFTKFSLEKGYDKETLEKSGLSIFPENAPNGIDRFRERVMFPIHSFSGRILGFGGRILNNNLKTAKYLNSPETEIYHKSNVLYGLYQSKQAISKHNHCLLVEGYMDVIALHQAGLENVVASSGTALTVEQIKLIKRLTENVTILFDGDAAGIKASFRSIDMLLSEGMNIRIALFPDGDDPDSFSRKHPQDYVEKFIRENAKDFIDFKAEILFRETGSDPIKKAEAIREIVKSVAFVTNGLKQEIYLKQVATQFQLSEQNLFNELQLQKDSKNQDFKPKLQKEQSQQIKLEVVKEPELSINPLILLEDKLVELMLKFGDFILEESDADGNKYETTVIQTILHHLEEDDCEIQTEINQKIIREIRLGLQENELRSGNFFFTLMDDEISGKMADTMINPYDTSDWSKFNIYFSKEEEVVQKLVKDIVLRHKREYIVKLVEDLKNQLDSYENKDDVYQHIIKLMTFKNQLDAKLFRIL
ncbi:DNA primase [Chryseobacterium sp. T1]